MGLSKYIAERRKRKYDIINEELQPEHQETEKEKLSDG